MPVTGQDLIDQVRRNLDELSATGAQDLSSTLVRDRLASATRIAIEAAPPSLLYPAARDVAGGATLTRTTVTVSDAKTVEYARVVPENDAQRILSVRLSNWIVPVPEQAIADALGEAYASHRSGENEATTRYPAAFLTNAATASASGFALDCFPATESVTVAELVVVPDGLAPEQAPASLIDAVVWYACAGVAGAYLKDGATAAVCTTNAENSMAAAAKAAGRLAPHPRQRRLTNRTPKPLG